MMTPEERVLSARASKARYDKDNAKVISVKYNFKTDADIFARFAKADNVCGFVKQCIREHIAEEERRGELF